MLLPILANIRELLGALLVSELVNCIFTLLLFVVRLRAVELFRRCRGFLLALANIARLCVLDFNSGNFKFVWHPPSVNVKHLILVVNIFLYLLHYFLTFGSEMRNQPQTLTLRTNKVFLSFF